MDKKESTGSGFKIKALFKIEFIFIYIAVLNFGFSIVCKTYTNKKIANLNSQMIKIQLEENSGIFNHQNLIQKLEYDYEPFTYFDSELKAELSQILTQQRLALPACHCPCRIPFARLQLMTISDVRMVPFGMPALVFMISYS